MISKPEATCPRCGGRLTVLDAVDVSRHAETVTYYCECDCGAANLTVTRGQVTGITPREPLQIPDCEDDPITEEEYLAQAQ
jgi:hypothetical protein